MTTQPPVTLDTEKGRHTKGPWAVRPRERFSDGAFEGFFKIEGFIADSKVQEYRVAHVVDANDSPQNEANARLIAAAPDLLEALKEAEAVVAIFLPHNEYEDGTPKPGPSAQLVKIRSAIARAQGETL